MDKMDGHSNVETTMIYTHVVKNLRNQTNLHEIYRLTLFCYLPAVCLDFPCLYEPAVMSRHRMDTIDLTSPCHYLDSIQI